MRLTRDEVRELLPAFSVGALDTEEIQAVENALKLYPELLRELHAFSDVTAKIASVGAMAPPPALRARFLEAVADEAGAARTAAHARTADRDTVRPFNSTTKPSSITRGPRRVFPVLMGLALAASLMLLLKARRDISRLQTQLDSQVATLTASGARIAEQDTVLSTLLGGEQSLFLVTMQTPQQSGPGVRFFWNVAARRGVLHAYRLSPAPAGRAYQLWLIRDGKPVPSRVFNSDGTGRGLVTNIELPASLDGVSAVAITEEPEGGSVQPTTQPFLMGALRGTE